MSISLQDSESSIYSGITGNNNINFDFSKKTSENFSSNPTGQQPNNQGGEQFEINPESIKAQIGKEKNQAQRIHLSRVVIETSALLNIVKHCREADIKSAA